MSPRPHPTPPQVSSGGSRGSAKSKSNYEPLNAKQAKRLYYC